METDLRKFCVHLRVVGKLAAVQTSPSAGTDAHQHTRELNELHDPQSSRELTLNRSIASLIC